MTQPRQHWLYLFSLVVIWGSAFMFTRIALNSFPPATLVAIRICLGALTLLIALPFLKISPYQLSKRLLLFFFIMAIVGNSLPFYLISWGQQHVSSGLAGILMAIMPLATLFMAHFFLTGETLTKRRFIGFLSGFIGIVVLMGPSALMELRTTGITFFAQLAILGGALCYAAGTIIARLKPESDDIFTAVAVLSIASLMMLPLSLAVETPWIKPVTLASAYAMLFLGVIATSVATVIYFRLLRQAGATFLSQINYLIPLWALAMGAVFLQESVSWNSLVALLMILGGVALSQSRYSPYD